MEHKCIDTAANREEWTWHYHLGHLNFKDLKDLQKNERVMRLPSINIPTEICEECMQAKKNKSKFRIYVDRRNKNHLEVVYRMCMD